MQLANKVALVTGGSSGIGLAAAQRLAEGGATVVVLGRDRVRLDAAVASLHGRGEAVVADVAKPDDVARAMAEIASRHPRLDVVVLSAGVSNAPPITAMTVARYDTLMDVNCRGATFVFAQALPRLAEGASVVFVGSVGGRKGQPGDALYAASKGFIRAFVRSLGTDPALLQRKIRVNSVAPGPIDTPLTKDATSRPEVRTYVEEQLVPMKRWGRAAEVAEAIFFLASSASSFTTGAEITVDGGMAHA